MRSTFKSTLLALLAVAAFGASAAASASAHEFVASKTGTLTDAISTPVEFNVAESEGNAKCEKGTLPTGTGTVTELKRKSLIVSVTYPDCRLLGFRYSQFTSEWEVSAEGHMSLLKTFALAMPEMLCKWNVIPSPAEESTVAFTNSAPVKTVKAVRASKHMKEELATEQHTCGSSGETSTWAETFTLGVDGGTLQWK